MSISLILGAVKLEGMAALLASVGRGAHPGALIANGAGNGIGLGCWKSDLRYHQHSHTVALWQSRWYDCLPQ